MTIIVRSMYNFVNCLQFNIRYEKVERPAPVGGALVFLIIKVLPDINFLFNVVANFLLTMNCELRHNYVNLQHLSSSSASLNFV
jgi:hypothetical protein